MKRVSNGSVHLGIAALAALLLWSGATFAGSLYRWVDENGMTHFADQPPSTKTNTDVRVFSYETAQIVPAAAPRTAKRARVRSGSADTKKVVMYSAVWCGVCKRAKSYLREKRIPFHEYDVEKSAKGRRDFKRLKRRGVPLLLVGDTRLNGFTPRAFERAYAGL